MTGVTTNMKAVKTMKSVKAHSCFGYGRWLAGSNGPFKVRGVEVHA